MGAQTSKNVEITGEPSALNEAEVSIVKKESELNLSKHRNPNDDTNGLIPCVFTWSHGGQEVYVTGSFNDWSVQHKIKLVRSTHEFSVVHELPRGVHQFKFIVDDNWKYAPEQATQCDANGNINNIINISNYHSHAFRVPSEHEQARYAIYSQRIPDPTEFVEAPTLPYLLSRAPLALEQDLNPSVPPLQSSNISTTTANQPPPVSPDSTTPRLPNLYVPFQCTSAHVFHDDFAPFLFGTHVSVGEELHKWRPPIASYSSNKLANTILVTVNPLRPIPSSVASKVWCSQPDKQTAQFESDQKKEAAAFMRRAVEEGANCELVKNPLSRLLKRHRRPNEDRVYTYNMGYTAENSSSSNSCTDSNKEDEFSYISSSSSENWQSTQGNMKRLNSVIIHEP